MEKKSTKTRNAIITADTHLKRKPGLWSGRSEIAGDDEFSFEQLVDYAIENNTDLYLLGDVLDAVTNMPRPLCIFNKLMNRLNEAGIVVRYIQGNHEMVAGGAHDQEPWLAIFDNAENIHEKTFDFMGMKAYGIEYVPLAFAPLALCKVPSDVEVLFMHGTVDSVTPFNHHFEADMIPEHIKLVFAGDWHEHAIVDLENGRTLYYPGSTYLCSSSEATEKFFLEVTPELKVDSVPLQTRNIVKLSGISGKLDELDKALAVDDTLPEAIQRPVVIVDEPCSQDTYLLLNKHAHVYTLSGACKPNKDISDIIVDDVLSNEQILEQCMDREKRPDEFKFVLDVIENPAVDAIDRLKERLAVEV